MGLSQSGLNLIFSILFFILHFFNYHSYVQYIYIYIYYMQKRHVAMSHSCYRMYSLAYTLLGHWLRIISLSICTCLISLMQVTITTLCIYLKMHSTIENNSLTSISPFFNHHLYYAFHTLSFFLSISAIFKSHTYTI